jgi:hypothetical protein
MSAIIGRIDYNGNGGLRFSQRTDSIALAWNCCIAHVTHYFSFPR